MSTQEGNPALHPAKTPSLLEKIFAGTTTQSLIQTAGFVFAAVAAFGFAYAIKQIIQSTDTVIAPANYSWQALVASNIQIIATVVIAVLSALFALRLFSKAGSLTSQVIRDQDRKLLEPLISAANKEAISEYIRLASLSGFTGTFQYLGFTGLPLATVALTLILLAVSLGVKDPETSKAVFDMAKLTLGAFLGSFVQRNIETEKLTQTQATGGGNPTGSSADGGGAGSGGKDAAAEERASIGKDVDGLTAQVQLVRKAVDGRLATVDSEKHAAVEAIATSLAGIEEKIAAAQQAVRDAAQPIATVRAAQTEARAAAAQLDDLSQKLKAI